MFQYTYKVYYTGPNKEETSVYDYITDAEKDCISLIGQGYKCRITKIVSEIRQISETPYDSDVCR